MKEEADSAKMTMAGLRADVEAQKQKIDTMAAKVAADAEAAAKRITEATADAEAARRNVEQLTADAEAADRKLRRIKDESVDDADGLRRKLKDAIEQAEVRQLHRIAARRRTTLAHALAHVPAPTLYTHACVCPHTPHPQRTRKESLKTQRSKRRFASYHGTWQYAK